MAEELIYQRIADILAEGAVIGKDSRNQQQGFKYRGVDAVMNVFHPLLSKHQVFVVPTILDSTREERQTKSGGNLIYTIVRVEYKFYTTDGSFVRAVVQGEGMDSADKSGNKAMSVAFKYAMFQVFCIPTEEMDDPDATTPEPSAPSNQMTTYSTQQPKQGIKCSQCGKVIADTLMDGQMFSVDRILSISNKRAGVPLCVACMTIKK